MIWIPKPFCGEVVPAEYGISMTTCREVGKHEDETLAVSRKDEGHGMIGLGDWGRY